MLKQLLILVFIWPLITSKLPATFRKCDRKQADFNTCLLDAVQKAQPQFTQAFDELGLPALDPLLIPKLSISAGSNAAAFTQNYDNFTLEGLTKCHCLRFEFRWEKLAMDASCLCPDLISTFHYDFEGRILVIPLKGRGTGSAKLYGVNTTAHFELEKYRKKGKTFMKVTHTDFFMYPEKMNLHFEKLFGDDERANKNLNDVFNENWKALMTEVGPSYNEAIGKFLQSFIGRLFSKVSLEEMFGSE